MAGRMRPLRAGYIEVRLSAEDWSRLSASAKLEISTEIKLKVQECMIQYCIEESSHDQALTGSEVRLELKKLTRIFESSAKRLTSISTWKNYNILKDGKLALTVSELFQTECKEKYGVDFSLAFLSMLLNDLSEVSQSCEKRTRSSVVYDSNLNVLLSTLAEDFFYIAGKGPTTRECFKFIHVCCTILHMHLKQHDPNSHVFDGLGIVVTETVEGSTGEQQGRVKTRIMEGDRVRQSQRKPRSLKLRKKLPKTREKPPRKPKP